MHRRQRSRRWTRSVESICWLSIDCATLTACSADGLGGNRPSIPFARLAQPGPIHDAIFSTRVVPSKAMVWGGGKFPPRWRKRSNRRPQRNRIIARSWSVMERYVVGNIVRLAGGENGRCLLRRQNYHHRSQRCVDYLATYVCTYAISLG